MTKPFPWFSPCFMMNLRCLQAKGGPFAGVDCGARRALFLLLLIMASLSAAPAAARTIWVGPSSDTSCETNNLGIAVLSAAVEDGDDSIHLADGVTFNNISLALNGFDPDSDQGGLTIRGGFASCGDPNPTAGRTTLQGRVSDPIIEVSGSGGGRSVIELVNLVLRDSGERALEVSEGGEVQLTNVWVRNNSGAVRVEDNGLFSMESESWLLENSTSSGFGAGIFCTDDAVVNVGGPISGNFSGQWGGGIFASGSCQVVLRSKAWIQSNRAAVNGGGIAAIGSALISQDAASSTQILLKNNTADRGGAVYADGPETSVLLANAKIENNEAERGAAIYATLSSSVQIYRIPNNACSDPLRCSTLSFNRLGDDIVGAVAWVDGGARVVISETYVEGNGSNFGLEDQMSLFTASDASSSLELRNVTIYDNEARYITEGIGASQIEIEHVTTAGNFYPTPSGDEPAGLFQDAFSPSATVINSLLWDIGASPGAFGGSCNFAASAAALSNSTESTVIFDPLFIDPATGDLRLNPDSDAVDACLSATATRDLEMQSRPVDVENNPNGDSGQPGGVYDAGSDEVVPKIFADRFEGGSF